MSAVLAAVAPEQCRLHDPSRRYPERPEWLDCVARAGPAGDRWAMRARASRLASDRELAGVHSGYHIDLMGHGPARAVAPSIRTRSCRLVLIPRRVRRPGRGSPQSSFCLRTARPATRWALRWRSSALRAVTRRRAGLQGHGELQSEPRGTRGDTSIGARGPCTRCRASPPVGRAGAG
mgnify:CR=1 FL=1